MAPLFAVRPRTIDLDDSYRVHSCVRERKRGPALGVQRSALLVFPPTHDFQAICEQVRTFKAT